MAESRSIKRAIKFHAGLNHEGYLPEFITVTDGKTHDITAARTMDLPQGSIVVVDKAYIDYSWHMQLTDEDISFVTRLKSNAKYRVIERRDTLKSKGITSNQTIEFTSTLTSKNCPSLLSRIGYRDEESGKHYFFNEQHDLSS